MDLPVSDWEFEEVSAYKQRYRDGSDTLVLDIVEVPFLWANPKTFQQENWLLDPARRWVQSGRIGWDDLPAWVDDDAPLWINGDSSRGTAAMTACQLMRRIGFRIL